MGLSGKYGAIYLSSTGAGTPFADETTSANEDRTVYQIINPIHRYVDPNTPVVVKINDVIIPKSHYIFGYAGGKVYFREPLDAEDNVTVAGTSLTCAQFAECREWSMDVATDMIEVPVFQQDWKRYVPGQTSATGTFARWFTLEAGRWFLNRISAQSPLIMLLYTQYNVIGLDDAKYEVVAYLTSDGIKTMISGAIDEEVGFQTTGPINYVVG